MTLVDMPVGVSAELRGRGAAYAAQFAAPGMIDALIAESVRESFRAETVELLEYQLRTDGQEMRSPMRFGTSAAGRALTELHEHPDVLGLVAELAGIRMSPSKAAYLFFGDATDFIGLHTDIPACELTLLVGIDGDAPHLVIHPDLQRKSPEDLLQLAERTAGAPPGGMPFEVAPGEIVALVGGRVPHRTPPAVRTRPGVIASLCYVGSGEAL